MASVFQTFLVCSTAFGLGTLLFLSLPQSRLREFLRPIVSGAFALLCAAYCLSPVDLIPEIALGPIGLVDDAGALAAGVMAAKSAFRARNYSSN